LLAHGTKVEKQAKAYQWEMEDLRRVKDSQIAELEAEKGELGTMKQNLLDEVTTPPPPLSPSLLTSHIPCFLLILHYGPTI
jgi:hypothetical protein